MAYVIPNQNSTSGVPDQMYSDLQGYFNNSTAGSSMDWAGGKLVRNADGTATYTGSGALNGSQTFGLDTNFENLAANSPGIAQQWYSQYGYNPEAQAQNYTSLTGNVLGTADYGKALPDYLQGITPQQQVGYGQLEMPKAATAVGETLPTSAPTENVTSPVVNATGVDGTQGQNINADTLSWLTSQFTAPGDYAARQAPNGNWYMPVWDGGNGASIENGGTGPSQTGWRQVSGANPTVGENNAFFDKQGNYKSGGMYKEGGGNPWNDEDFMMSMAVILGGFFGGGALAGAGGAGAGAAAGAGGFGAAPSMAEILAGAAGGGAGGLGTIGAGGAGLGALTNAEILGGASGINLGTGAALTGADLAGGAAGLGGIGGAVGPGAATAPTNAQILGGAAGTNIATGLPITAADIAAGAGAAAGGGASGAGGGAAGAAGSGAGGLGSLLGSGGLGNVGLADLLGGLYSAYSGNQNSKDITGWLDKQMSDIDKIYAPGSPEYNYLMQEMERKDAAAGRNSQYGPRSVDLAARIADIKSGRKAQLAGALQNNMVSGITQGNNNLSGLIAGLGKSGANPTISDLSSLLTNLFK